jgi:hypothetical protein
MDSVSSDVLHCYGGVNASNLTGILLLYYPHRSIKCVLGLSC